MGKSFNDDVFNNDFDVANINGLSISQEAIQENKQKTTEKDIKLDLGNLDIDKYKKELEKQKKQKKHSLSDDLEIIQEELKRREEQQVQEQEEKERQEEQKKKDKDTVKRTMIFKRDYLTIIDGLANINNMQVKDVLNQLLEKSINELDPQVREKALKSGKKKKTSSEKNIF